jgi:putative ATP-binding cassette transporter
MNLFKLLLRTSRTTVVIAMLAGAVGGISNVALIGLIHLALNHGHGPLARLIGSPAKGAGAEPGPGLLASPGLIVAFVVMCLVVLLSKVSCQVLLINLSRRAVAQLCMHLSRRILAVPLRRLEEIGAPRLLASLTGDIPILAQAFNGIPVVATNLVVMVCCLIYLGWLSWSVLLAVMVFLVGGLGTYLLIARRARRFLRLSREHQDALMSHFRSLIDGIKELKIHRPRREAFVRDELQTTVDAVQKHNTTGQVLLAMVASSARLLFFILIGLLLFVLPHFRPVDVGTLSGYTLTILFVMSPVESLMMWSVVLNRARVALNKVESLGLSLSQGGDDNVNGQAETDPGWQSLELLGVTHQYHREREGGGFTLGPIDLALRPRELVYLVGGNGSGKTTLAKLLTGLYTPEAGEIRLNGKPVTAECREHYRQQFSAVFSDIFLFESLLGLGVRGLDEQARRYLEELQLDHKVEVKDGVFSTLDLSKGQRKRLALVTAYLEDRPVYVFDEWASDQDPLFKKIFYEELLPALKARGKAVLVITHDERYFHLADRMLQLEEGQLKTEVANSDQVHFCRPVPERT